MKFQDKILIFQNNSFVFIFPHQFSSIFSIVVQSAQQILYLPFSSGLQIMKNYQSNVSEVIGKN